MIKLGRESGDLHMYTTFYNIYIFMYTLYAASTGCSCLLHAIASGGIFCMLPASAARYCLAALSLHWAGFQVRLSCFICVACLALLPLPPFAAAASCLSFAATCLSLRSMVGRVADAVKQHLMYEYLCVSVCLRNKAHLVA